MWSKPPAHQRLGKNLENAHMKLTKQTDVIQENCNNTNGYVYGGKKFKLAQKHINDWMLKHILN